MELDGPLHKRIGDMEKAIRYEPTTPLVATSWEITAVRVLVLLALAAASVLAYAQVGVVSDVSLAAREWPLSEPGIMLASGSALLALGGVLRRIGG